MKTILVDTGPLVAIINPRDSQHAACGDYAANLTAPMLTTWPVITEAAYLLRKNIADVRALFRLVSNGDLQVAPLSTDTIAWFDRFFEQYADAGPQLADASLVYLAQSMRILDVFTLDARDFSIYRTDHGDFLRIHPEVTEG